MRGEVCMADRAVNGYQIPLNTPSYKSYVDETYEAFLMLARSLFPSSQRLTDCEDLAKLQDLYFLLKQGIVKVTEEKSQDGAASLFLEIHG